MGNNPWSDLGYRFRGAGLEYLPFDGGISSGPYWIKSVGYKWEVYSLKDRELLLLSGVNTWELIPWLVKRKRNGS